MEGRAFTRWQLRYLLLPGRRRRRVSEGPPAAPALALARYSVHLIIGGGPSLITGHDFTAENLLMN